MDFITGILNAHPKVSAIDPLVNASATLDMKEMHVNEHPVPMTAQATVFVHTLNKWVMRLFLLTTALALSYLRILRPSAITVGIRVRLVDASAILNMAITTALSACVPTELMSWIFAKTIY